MDDKMKNIIIQLSDQLAVTAFSFIKNNFEEIENPLLIFDIIISSSISTMLNLLYTFSSESDNDDIKLKTEDFSKAIVKFLSKDSYGFFASVEDVKNNVH